MDDIKLSELVKNIDVYTLSIILDELSKNDNCKNVYNLLNSKMKPKKISLVFNNPYNTIEDMICTQRIANTSSKPIPKQGYEAINVLKWQAGPWKSLCPYLLKTDGNEKIKNPGGVLFENFYQGCKVYKTVYSNKVYPSRFHIKPEYLWWEYESENPKGDVLYDEKTDTIDHESYLLWRDSLWECENPIRYPNKKKSPEFSIRLKKTKQGLKEIRMDYITARKDIYYREYVRLIKELPAYQTLLSKLKKGEKLMICELDVPARGKRGEFGRDCDETDTCVMSIEKLEILLNDPSEAFGHGLCIAYSLLQDLQE